MSSAMSDPLLEDGDTDTVDVGMANLLRRKKGSVNKNYLPEQKLAAAQLLYTLVEPSSHALSFSELQSIFLQRLPEDFIYLFERLIFYGSIDSVEEAELVRYTEKFLNDIGEMWPLPQQHKLSTQEMSKKRRVTYASVISQILIQRREQSHKCLIKDVHEYTQLKQTATFKTSEFISHFAPQLLECLYESLGKGGYEKKYILSNMKIFISKCEEETRWWKAVKRRCKEVVGDKPSMDLEEFKRLLSFEDFTARRLFEMTDKDGNGMIDQTEMFAVTSLLATGNNKEKLNFLFTMYDENGDGLLDKSELTKALDTCFKSSKLDVNFGEASKLAEILFENANCHCSGDSPTQVSNGEEVSETPAAKNMMTFNDLNCLLKRHPLIYDNLNFHLVSVSQHAHKKKSQKFQQQIGKTVRSVVKHAHIYSSLWIWLLLLTGVTCGIAGVRAYAMITTKYEDATDVAFVMAKVFGQVLNFLFSLLLCYNLNGIISAMKKTYLRHILPLDDNIYLHKLTAVAAFITSVFHTIAHIANMVLKYHSDGTVPPFTFTVDPVTRIYWTGFILLVLMCVFIGMSSEKTRNKSYTAFYISHRVLAILWFVCLFPHAKNFIYWFVGPASLFLLERIYRAYHILKQSSHVELVSTHENLTILSIKRPEDFVHHPGDYVLVRIPEVSGFAWRPFTISSNRPDVITLHIRKVGWWTGKLFDKVYNLERTTERLEHVDQAFKLHVKLYMEDPDAERPEGGEQLSEEPHDTVELITDGNDKVFKSSAVVKRSTASKPNNRRKPTPVAVQWKVYLNGPFSTPSHDILKTDHAILVAGGVGMTPFASILESVVLLLRENSKICPCGCNHRVFFRRESGFRLKRIDLFWLTRSQKSLGWFMEIFKELEEEQLALGLDPPLVNVHLYLTGVYKDTDMRGTFLHLALNTSYDNKSADLLTGLRAQTKHGRPDWGVVLPEVIDDMRQTWVSNNPNLKIRSKLYACGPARLCKDLRHHCSKLKISFKEEVFG